MERQFFLSKITEAFDITPIVALLGPRQCGKTTLATHYSQLHQDMPVHFFDLEDVSDLSRLENPKLALEPLEGLIIIDEIQRRPDLFPMLRVLVDRHPSQRFLILGSASRELIQQSSESLAGRLSYIELPPFSLFEVQSFHQLWERGGFPKSYLAKSAKISLHWREGYITTYLEQDIPNLGISIPAATLRRFWMMLAHYHGQILNVSELARSFGISAHTVHHYLEILEGTFMIRSLPPWYENISKRQVKSSKIYLRDSGLLNILLGISSYEELMRHPKLGACFEGFALEEVIRRYQLKTGEVYFWATHNQAELDLFVIRHGKRSGFEFKYTDHPKITPSMLIALENLKLDELIVIVPFKADFKLHEKIKVLGIENPQ